MNEVLSVSINLIIKSTFMLYPIMPESCNKVFNILNININDLSYENINNLKYQNIKINKSIPIFPRIEIND